MSSVQHLKLRKHFDCYRRVYNLTVEFINSNGFKEFSCDLKTKKVYCWSDRSIRDYLLPIWIENESWLTSDCIHKNSMIEAIYEAFNSWKTGCSSVKKKLISHFRLGFKSRKAPIHTTNWQCGAISTKEGYTLCKKGLGLKLNFDSDWSGSGFKITYTNKRFELIYTVEETLRENQSRTDFSAVALDPGVRTFQTCWDSFSNGFKFSCDSNRLNSLLKSIDKINKKISGLKSVKKIAFYRNINQGLELKINRLVTELHRKIALWLVTNYDVIILPDFNTSEMVKKVKSGRPRKIDRKTTRLLSVYSHFKFKQYLSFKCNLHNKILIVNSEEYTSKTLPDGKILDNLGGKKTIRFNDTFLDRDYNGARNILIKTISDVVKR